MSLWIQSYVVLWLTHPNNTVIDFLIFVTLFPCVVYGVMEMGCTVFNEFGRMLPMGRSDLNESPSRIKCVRGPDNKTECRNYCACGIMSKCTAGSSWREHCECKFSRKSSAGDRCMYYRDTINGHCDCVNAQRETKCTNNRWWGGFLLYRPDALHPVCRCII